MQPVVAIMILEGQAGGHGFMTMVIGVGSWVTHHEILQNFCTRFAGTLV